LHHSTEINANNIIMKLTKNFWILALAATQLTFFSCTTDDETTSDDAEEQSSAQNATYSDTYSDEDLEIALDAQSEVNTGGRSLADICATISHDDANKQVVIDFGTEGCTGPYGRVRKGKIIITYSSTLGDDIANRIITFDNYFVNNRQISGTINLRDIEINLDGNYQSTKGLVDYKVTFPNGQFITTNGSVTRELTAGGGDGILENNEFEVTGSYTTVSDQGASFSHTITEALIVKMSCVGEGGFARVAGTIEMKKTGLAGNSRVTTIEYGDGTCDGEFTITTPRKTVKVSIEG